MAKEMGYHTFFWSLAYVDWYQDKQPSKEEAFEKLLGRIHPGAIVLLHSTSSTNASILDELLTKWEEMRYTFGTLEELVASGSDLKKSAHDPCILSAIDTDLPTLDFPDKHKKICPGTMFSYVPGQIFLCY